MSLGVLFTAAVLVDGRGIKVGFVRFFGAKRKDRFDCRA